MCNLILKRLKTNWMYYFLVFIGYVFSLLVISFGISFIKCSKDIALERTLGNIHHRRVIDVSSNKSSKIDYERLVPILTKYAKTTSITIGEINIQKPVKDRIIQVPIKGTIFNETPEWIPKVTRGRYFKSKESISKENIAVVGNGVFLNNILEKNGKMKIGDVEFKVIGEVGKPMDCSNYGGTVFIPINSLPNILKNNLNDIEISMMKNGGDPKDEIFKLSNDLKSILKLNVEEKKVEQSSTFYTTLSTYTFVSFLILLVAITNITVLIFYLMLKNKRNFMISIAIGGYKKVIWLQIFSELLIVSLSSVVVATILNKLLIPFVKCNLTNIDNIESLTFNTFNIGMSILISVLMSFIISTISVRKFFKLDLILELKGE